MKSSSIEIPTERIESTILLIRDEKVMLDRELANLYGVPTKALKRAVRRNIDRFPEDFMFVLDRTEFKLWRSQFVTSKSDRQGLRYAPMAFTEHGILMLSSVLNSVRAIHVNIEIMRAFVRLRRLVATHRELTAKLTELERRVTTHDEHIRAIFDAIRQLMTPPPVKVKQIGFRSKALKK